MKPKKDKVACSLLRKDRKYKTMNIPGSKRRKTGSSYMFPIDYKESGTLTTPQEHGYKVAQTPCSKRRESRFSSTIDKNLKQIENSLRSVTRKISLTRSTSSLLPSKNFSPHSSLRSSNLRFSYPYPSDATSPDQPMERMGSLTHKWLGGLLPPRARAQSTVRLVPYYVNQCLG